MGNGKTTHAGIVTPLKRRRRLDVSFDNTLAYGDTCGQAMFILGFGAELIKANEHANALAQNHRAFFQHPNGFGLAHQARHRKLIKLVNAAIFDKRPQYLKLDNGCDEEQITGVIHPFAPSAFDGNLTNSGLVLFRVIAARTPLPYLAPLQGFHNLTPRQLDILKPFCSGFSVQEAGMAISVSSQRAREMFCEIYRRLGVEGKSGLIAFLSRLPVDPDVE